MESRTDAAYSTFSRAVIALVGSVTVALVVGAAITQYRDYRLDLADLNAGRANTKSIARAERRPSVSAMLSSNRARASVDMG